MTTTTLTVRSGSSLKAKFFYVEEDDTSVDTTDYEARLQFRAIYPHTKVLMDLSEGDTTDSPFYLDTTGSWILNLPSNQISNFPPKVRWELELVSKTDPDDVTFLESGQLLVIPEAVK